MAPVLHVIMFPKFIAKVHIYSYNDVLIMYAHIQSSQTMWPAMLTFKTETFQPIPFPLPYCCQIPHWQPLSNMQLTSSTPRHWIIIWKQGFMTAHQKTSWRCNIDAYWWQKIEWCYAKNIWSFFLIDGHGCVWMPAYCIPRICFECLQLFTTWFIERIS